VQAPPGAEGFEHDAGGIFAEINITPLTDVFLVLLIILMVVSSSVIEEEKQAAYEKGLLAERALQVMTPEGAGSSDIVPDDVVVSVLPDGTVFVENDEVPASELDARFTELGRTGSVRVVLRGDQTASYLAIMDVLGRLSRAGLTNIALASRD